MTYYEIAILEYLGGDKELLTYKSSEKLEAGMAVKVPLRNKKVIGIVLSEVVKPSFESKEILEVLYDKPILTSNLLKLAFWIKDYYGSSLAKVLMNMVPSGIAKKRREIKDDVKPKKASEKLKLTSDQKKVFDDILSAPDDKPHLIFGVTGSGKTEIYLQLVEKTIEEGKQAIVLVPEIALTPQTLQRFSSRFGKSVALLHSRLKETQRYANWEKSFLGNADVIVGSRSALFAPLPNLGLIIIDEEQESSYKQDQTPRYDAVKTAETLAKISGARLVFGSATPSLRTFFRTQNKEIHLHTLNKRIVQDSLPETEIVDMRNEFLGGNKSIFSEKLQSELKRTLEAGHQVMLFLNRRGMSTFVSCRECGYVEKCPNCDIPLTFHLNNLDLRCHHCNFSKKTPASCPSCKSWAIKYFGTGTQRVETELKKLFGDRYKMSRIDADTTKKSGSHEEIFDSFSRGEFQILIGTQMMAKGWDLPNIALVGVVSADTMSNFPDFTASERTFDLITQVAGRTGRGDKIGKVIIQTYNPENFAIRAASRHSFNEFYTQEIEHRRDLGYPPFANLIKLLYNNVDQELAKNETETIAVKISEALKQPDISFDVLGPSPSFIPKKANKYYWQITLKIFEADEPKIIETVKKLRGILDNTWSIDVDPIDLI